MSLFSRLSFNKTPHLGLTLSGGGAKCMAQIGMLQYLTEQGIKIDTISGASGGALVGTLYGLGHSPIAIHDFFLSNKLFDFDHFSFRALGIINTKGLAKTLTPLISTDNFDALNIPVYISTTNLNTGKPQVFSQGELIAPLLASCAYPGVFTPVEIGGELFIDGGVTNNFPSDVIHKKCKHHLGMYLCPVTHKSNDEFSHAFDVFDRVFEIYSSTQLHKSKEMLDICLAPEGIEHWGAFNLSKASLEAIYDLGYSTTKALFESDEEQQQSIIRKLLK